MRTITTTTTSGQCFANRLHGRGGLGLASESLALSSLVTVPDRAEARRSGRPPP